MAYIVRSAIDFRHNLKYEFEGADLQRELPDKNLQYEGGTLKYASIGTCFSFSIPVPEYLFDALPKRIVVKPWKDGFIPDFGNDGSRFIVSDRFVSIVEELEPGKHQFLKIPATVAPDGRPLAKSFYLMNVLVRLAAVNLELSTVRWKTITGGSTLLEYTSGAAIDQRLVLHRSITEGHHLWRGTREQFAINTYCSDELKRKMEEHGLSELWLEHVEEL